jgi:hypothetical protein
MMGKLTQGSAQDTQARLRLCSGKSGRCSRPKTKTEPAKEKCHQEFEGIISSLFLSCALRSVSKLAALTQALFSQLNCAA